MMDGSAEISPRAQALKDQLLGEFSLTVDDVAGVLEVDRTTVYRYIQEGALAALKLGREYRLSEADVREFLQALIRHERERVGQLRLQALAGEAGDSRLERGRGHKRPRGGRAAGHFGRYSERAQRAIVHAQEVAAARQAQAVVPADILLSLVDDQVGGIGLKALQNLDVDLGALRQGAGELAARADPLVEDAGGRGPKPEKRRPHGRPHDGARPQFSRRGKELVMERAHDARQALDHAYVGTEHLLLGLYADPACRGLLEGAGATEEAVRNEVLRLMAPPRERG